ncbi:hypothetical protein TWF225_009981 [Orbilia oligospora]|nr:hypothetical protein TWF225_009981 [Orbilia oligospora]KAF3243923.1 hypothetical protein TWF128_009861 [Orbilia oligospora]KAF3245877.1 hypothetical protein TWF217_010058 [Orbilia oligospora]KAF3283923.1 hypothetical protein TWF132_009936 [Orbilia oligospora]
MTEVTASTPTDALVDTSPIVPPSAPHPQFERRLSLRPEAQSLVDRNILHSSSTVASSLVAHKDELKHAMIADHLKRGLASRPERKELEERGILPDEHVSPAILGKTKELEKNMLTDSLNTKLTQRPRVEEVMEKGILSVDEDPRSPH